MMCVDPLCSPPLCARCLLFVSSIYLDISEIFMLFHLLAIPVFLPMFPSTRSFSFACVPSYHLQMLSPLSCFPIPNALPRVQLVGVALA